MYVDIQNQNVGIIRKRQNKCYFINDTMNYTWFKKGRIRFLVN